jgi:dynein heavy chain
LSEDVFQCTTQLDRAERLMSGLSSEKVRWESTLSDLKQQDANVTANMLVNAGTVAYLGAFTADFRQRLEAEWRSALKKLGLSCTPNTDISSSLGDPIQIRAWTSAGLPSDHLSVQNAIILSKSRRFPLMIDPQLQANRWIKNLEKEKLTVVNLNQNKYLDTIIRAVQFGMPVLLENIGQDMDPALEPLLLKQTFIQSGVQYIKIGDDVIEYNNDFRLYLTTKLRNPHYSPEASVKVTLLNFFITPSGLEDQMLGNVVKVETPELERTKTELMLKNLKMRKDLKDLQDNILQMLTDNKDKNILEDEKLINALAESKVASATIQEKVAQSEETEKEIDVTRNKYRPVAIRSSLLFFCISDLTNVDPMYQYSLQWFIKLFYQCIESSEQNEDVDIRIQTLINNFTYSLYTNVCQSLFEKHKLLFSFVLCVRILQGEDKISNSEWREFLTGGVEPSGNVMKKPEKAGWITDQQWSQILSLSKLEPCFHGLEDNFAVRVDEFKTYFDSPEVHRLPVPGGEKWNVPTLTPFQKMMILRCLRPDKVTESIVDFVTESLGSRFVEPPRFDLNRSFKDSSNTVPLVFILSAGADTRSEFDKFRDFMRVKRLEEVSLGRGTEKVATQAIKDAVVSGSWVLLQNCHLAVSFMDALEKLVEGFTDENHGEFRLWLTSMPTPRFPVSVLQNSVKMTLEPPLGLRSNLMGSYDNYNDAELEHETKPTEYKKLLFSLCFFHAIIQERRKFGPLGWNIPYEYTSGDLAVCVMQLKRFLSKYDAVPYKVIKFLTGQINYGGRVTDDWDRRTLMTIINRFVTPDVMKDNYLFSETLPEYKSILAGDYKSYIEYLKQLPLNPHPEIFGLHENAEITYNSAEFGVLTSTLLSMQGGGKGAAGSGVDDVIEAFANDALKRIPKPFDLLEVKKKYPVMYEESMNTVIVQEVIRYNKLLHIVHSSCQDILKAIKGLVVMSGPLEMMGTSIFNNRVPEMWNEVAYPSLMPLNSWVTDLIQRCEFIDKWYKQGIPKVYWISGFFFPQGFLTGTLQNYARRNNVAIDRVSFSFEVLQYISEDQIDKAPSEGCYIRGLFLEGARWSVEDKCLVESRSKELYTTMPIIWFRPIKDRQPSNVNVFYSPVYKTLQRAGTLSTTGHSTNYVLTIELPSKQPQDHWIKRGVAAVCGLKYAAAK